MWCLGDNAGHSWGLAMKRPPWDICLSTWSLACVVVWKGCGTFSRCSLAGGSVLLEAGFENTSCSVSACWVWMSCDQPASDSRGLAFPALRGDRLYQSGTGSQNKTPLHCIVFIKVFITTTETQKKRTGTHRSLRKASLWKSLKPRETWLEVENVTHEGKAPKLELWYSRTLTQKVMDVPAQTKGKFSSPLHLSYPAPWWIGCYSPILVRIDLFWFFFFQSEKENTNPSWIDHPSVITGITVLVPQASHSPGRLTYNINHHWAWQTVNKGLPCRQKDPPELTFFSRKM